MNYTPSQRLLAHLLRYGRGAAEALSRLKAMYPEVEDVPGCDTLTRAALSVLYSGGACDLGELDIRTDGRFHDPLTPLVSGALPDPEPFISELLREREKRTINAAILEAHGRLTSEGADPRTVAFELRKTLDSVGADQGADNWEAYVDLAESEMKALADRGNEFTTGLIDLDRMFQFRRGHMGIVAAPTSHGKTAFSLRLVHRAAQIGLRVAFLGFEDYSTIPLKLASLSAGIPLWWFTRHWEATDEQKRRAREALAVVKSWEGLAIYSPMELSEFDAKVRGFKPDILVLDYVQRYAECYGSDDKRGAVGKACSDFQSIVQRSRSYGVLCSQVRRREFGKFGDDGGFSQRRPALGDLKESGDLENYADWVLMLYWPQKDKRGTEFENDLDREKYLVTIAKDKLGPGGECEVRFDGATMTYRDRYSQ